MKYFCTYFDKNYLTRGLVLFDSLKVEEKDYTIFILCIDTFTFEYFTSLNNSKYIPIPLSSLEKWDPELAETKKNRTIVEYFFTFSPCLPLFIFHHFPEVHLLAYMDSDLCFFGSADELFKELGQKSIFITPHNFPPELSHLSIFGQYNVGFQIYRKNETGITCLKRWRRQCIEWCYDKLEGEKFADQKYLDEWPTLYKEELVISKKRGANLAPWNIRNTKIERSNNSHTLVNGEILIFYHFNRVRLIRNRIFVHGLEAYNTPMTESIKQLVYLPYLKALNSKNKFFTFNKESIQRLQSKYLNKDVKYLLRNNFAFFFLTDNLCLTFEKPKLGARLFTKLISHLN